MNKLTTIISSLLIASTLTACDNKDKKPTNPFGQTTIQKYSKDTALTGSVNNAKGMVLTAKIKVTNEQGKTITTGSVIEGNYSITIKANTPLPLIITVTPTEKGTDKLQVVIVSKAVKKYTINELTTIIAKKAKEMGGYTYQNMEYAAMNSTAIPDSNKTTGGFRGDPTSQYGGWH